MATDRGQGPAGAGQRSDSSRLEDGPAPSRSEIQQAVTSLYNRAETDSGTFNATRAMSLRSSRSGGSGAPRGGARRPSAPETDAVARQLFDVARNSLGPTIPAVLPRDRASGREAGGLQDREGGGLAVGRGRAALRRASDTRCRGIVHRSPPKEKWGATGAPHGVVSRVPAVRPPAPVAPPR